MKAIFEFGLLPSEKLKESCNEIGYSLLILKNMKNGFLYKARWIFFQSTNYCLKF